MGERADGDTEAATEETMEELHRRLQEGLREHAGQEAARTAVLGTLLLQAENLWAELVPEADKTADPHEQ